MRAALVAADAPPRPHWVVMAALADQPLPLVFEHFWSRATALAAAARMNATGTGRFWVEDWW